ncbi:MAG TPA: alpha/beta hydrolase-fold protein [Gaiellaceae bacterium]|jgi:S-formylglutathione hydrolase FrmB|nr:alpha/beta hydrolase-fold protein [Gaiellaceae bacterium]
MRRAAFAVLVLAVAAATAAVALGRQTHSLDEGIRSVALGGTAHALVVLPDGYATSGKRYPVVYFLHGLPAGPGAYRNSTWLADTLERVGPAILVMPQGAKSGDTDAEYLNWGTGRNWETFIAEELPEAIDKRFRTVRSRSGRAMIGLSAGGFGATVLGLHHLGRFSVVESWSGYFHPTDPTGTQSLNRGPSTSAHNLISVLKVDERRRPTFFAFYVGDGDTRFLAENLQLNRELNAAHVRHLFTVYSGAHTTALWQAHARVWLGLALAHLAHAA